MSDTPRVNRYKTVAAIDVIFGVFGIVLAILILVDGNSLLALTVLAIGCLSAGFGVALWVSDDIVNGRKLVRSAVNNTEISHPRECPECGETTYQFERCHECGDIPWK